MRLHVFSRLDSFKYVHSLLNVFRAADRKADGGFPIKVYLVNYSRLKVFSILKKGHFVKFRTDSGDPERKHVYSRKLFMEADKTLPRNGLQDGGDAYESCSVYFK